MMLKLILSRFVIALMILSTLSLVMPAYAGLDNVFADDSNASSMNNQNDIGNSCHLNKSSVTSSCCYIDCDLKYAPFLPSINSYPEIHSHSVIHASAIRLHQIYLTPVTPPPIIS